MRHIGVNPELQNRLPRFYSQITNNKWFTLNDVVKRIDFFDVIYLYLVFGLTVTLVFWIRYMQLRMRFIHNEDVEFWRQRLAQQLKMAEQRGKAKGTTAVIQPAKKSETETKGSSEDGGVRPHVSKKVIPEKMPSAAKVKKEEIDPGDDKKAALPRAKRGNRVELLAEQERMIDDLPETVVEGEMQKKKKKGKGGKTKTVTKQETGTRSGTESAAHKKKQRVKPSGRSGAAKPQSREKKTTTEAQATKTRDKDTKSQDGGTKTVGGGGHSGGHSGTFKIHMARAGPETVVSGRQKRGKSPPPKPTSQKPAASGAKPAPKKPAEKSGKTEKTQMSIGPKETEAPKEAPATPADSPKPPSSGQGKPAPLVDHDQQTQAMTVVPKKPAA
ncbi:unnamed protein product, partial [Mesorhabditis spiculigera]